MSGLEELMRKELNILFNALCDGLRQEVRHRSLSHLVTGKDFSLTQEREAGMASSLASHLRIVGFMAQVESYFHSGSTMRRPDFRIWLPASRKYIYLELKAVAWGSNYRSYYYKGVLDDIKKLSRDTDPQNQPNGLIALGFSKPEEQSDQLMKKCKELSQQIIEKYQYEEIGLDRVDLQGMDERSHHGVIGLWVREFS